MILTYRGRKYDCVSAEKRSNEIVIHTGEYVEDAEIIHHIYGDIDSDEIVLEGGTWTEATASTDDVLNTLLGVTV